MILISTKTFPRNRTFVPAVLNALGALLARPDGIPGGRVVFLSRQ